MVAAPLVAATDSGQRPLMNRLSGRLSLDSDHEPFTFNYFTRDVHEGNWIALYCASGGGPVDEAYVQPPLVWNYARERQGSVHLAVNQMVDCPSPGEYQAYFLARNGYRWLAPPINVSLASPSVGDALRFPVDQATLHNARQLEHYFSRIDGLLLGRGSAAAFFQKVDGASWVHIDANGTVSGVPGIFAPQRSQVIVRATAKNGSSAIISLTIPVRRVYQRLVQDLRILTVNLWHGGTQVRDYHEKQLRFIINTGADIVGLQETTSDHATRLGQALGWYHWQSGKSVGIISRYPIVEEYGEITRAGGVRISLNGKRPGVFDSQLNFWTIHTGAYPYGPYDFCYDNLTAEEVLADEVQSGRVPQVMKTLDGIQSQLDDAQSVPVIYTGDFNAPSHLDWVEGAREKHCGVANFSWPTSVLMAQRGLLDSFRIAHPDAVREPGNSWSPILPRHDGETGPVEPQDRIDFIYHKGKLEVVDSRRLVAGKPRPSPNHGDNEWTSDHAAVLTHYQVL